MNITNNTPITNYNYILNQEAQKLSLPVAKKDIANNEYIMLKETQTEISFNTNNNQGTHDFNDRKIKLESPIKNFNTEKQQLINDNSDKYDDIAKILSATVICFLLFIFVITCVALAITVNPIIENKSQNYTNNTR